MAKKYIYTFINVYVCVCGWRKKLLTRQKRKHFAGFASQLGADADNAISQAKGAIQIGSLWSKPQRGGAKESVGELIQLIYLFAQKFAYT